MEYQNLVKSRSIYKWFAIIAVAIILGTAFEYFGLPASHFFGGVVTGMIVAIFKLVENHNISTRLFDAALAVTGVVLGAYFSPSSLGAIAQNFLPIIIISLATLLLSLLMGILLSKISKISLATSLLGMLAGALQISRLI